jgi:hypothetical protein
VNSSIYLNKLSWILFATHLALVFGILEQHFEGSWGGFLLFLLDFPVSLLSFLPVGWASWFFFGVIGSLWWYVIGIVAVRSIKRK